MTSVRPTVYVAAAELGDDLAKKLATRFSVRRFADAATAVAHLLSGEPDALVCALDDPTWAGAATIAALRAAPETSWPAYVVIASDAPPLPADLVLPPRDLARVASELARVLAVERT